MPADNVTSFDYTDRLGIQKMPPGYLLIGHLSKGNPGTFEDVANLAMMLHQRDADPKVLADAAAQGVEPHQINCNAVSQYPAGKCNCGKGE